MASSIPMKKPLHSLIQATKDAQRPKRKPAKPVGPSKDVERYYYAQLRSLVRAMAKEVNTEVLPVIKAQREEYTADALMTHDDWAQRVIDAIGRVSSLFATEDMQAAFRRIAERFVRRVDQSTTERLVKSVKNAVGVDIKPMLSERDMADYVQASIAENVSLIQSIPEQYFKRIESTIYSGMKDGMYPTVIAEQLQEDAGVSYRRAKGIARDQTAKLTGQVNEKRQQQAGITHYKAVDSGDERTTGKPGGRYPNAKISCWGIARKDVGNGPGVYSWKEGASWGGQAGLHPGRHHVFCRCTGSPVFSWELEE